MSITMNFNRADLLEKLTTNRDKHGGEYKKARAGWLKEVEEEAQKIVASAKEGDLTVVKPGRGHFPNKGRNENITSILFEMPEDHTDQYNRIIEMLTMATDPTITLNDSQFREYVQDEWGWKEDWVFSNSKYMG